MEVNMLHTVGYTVLKKAIAIDADDVATLEKQVAANKVYIFNEDWDNNDKKRYQAVLQEKEVGFISRLNELVDAIQPNLKRSQWVVLKSDAGCHKQMAHLDYVPTPAFQDILHGENVHQIPLLVFVAVMDNTYIHLWEKSIEVINGTYDGEPIQSIHLRLNAGDILVFRSDMIHAGSEYDQDNIRLHCYLDSPLLHREEDTTFIIKLDAPSIAHWIVE